MSSEEKPVILWIGDDDLKRVSIPPELSTQVEVYVCNGAFFTYDNQLIAMTPEKLIEIVNEAMCEVMWPGADYGDRKLVIDALKKELNL